MFAKNSINDLCNKNVNVFIYHFLLPYFINVQSCMHSLMLDINSKVEK